MKHCFIINPAAGQGNAESVLLPKIMSAVKSAGVSYEIHRTINVGDGESHVRDICQSASDSPVRFYSCGGDGTLNEVVSGAYGCPNAEVACIPAGTGNDFVRMFTDRKAFLDIGAMIEGVPVPVDVLEYRILGEFASRFVTGSPPKTSGYAVNMLNMGFDANVVTRTQTLKKKPLLGGTGAYIAGVVSELARMRKLDVKVAFDGGEPYDARLLLAGIGNGRYSGGGFNGIPMAEIDDGYMDVLMVKMMTRRVFAKFVKSYHDGVHIGKPEMAAYLMHVRCKEMEIETEEETDLAVDGETCGVRGKVKFAVADEQIRFVLPKGLIQ
ncbi:MAG: hypothetical protein LBK04_05165 [Clostridiales Family XIII bacterium]|jgi:YegS/Rv2252/BmrU family lipid kinase|nr:hypothetical protein [Clostridiales Family XIII bacterium]